MASPSGSPGQPGKPLAVVALGGNALQPPGEPLSVEGMQGRLTTAATTLQRLARRHRLVVTHGNGPQVGAVLASQPDVPLWAAGAQTQGGLGALIAQALGGRVSNPVVNVLTHVLVSVHDPSFAGPTKPIGPTLARRPRAADGSVAPVDWGKVDGGWRRLVASPRPLEVVEAPAVATLVEAGFTVVAGGGGGVPVVKGRHGFDPVDAVVDKDATSALLAAGLGAQALYLLTDVPYVQRDHGKAGQRDLRRMTVAQARSLMAEGQFPPGSMGPKVQACLDFLASSPHGTAVVGSVADAPRGTRIAP